jgi:putative FmdB family regulatory protein
VPIYEYLCQDCSYKFELKQSITEDPVATCSKCGKSVSRIISPPAIMFKGNGWYVTDYSDKMKPPTGDSNDSPAGAKKDTTAAAANAAPAAATPATTSAPSGGASSSGTSSGST